MVLIIRELNTGKTHKRTIQDRSVSFEVEGRFVVVRDYYTAAPLHRFNISKYGSVECWVE